MEESSCLIFKQIQDFYGNTVFHPKVVFRWKGLDGRAEAVWGLSNARALAGRSPW